MVMKRTAAPPRASQYGTPVASPHRLAFDRIEPLPAPGHGDEEVTGRKPRRESRAEIFECFNDLPGSQGIDPTEGSASKRRKPDPEHGANVAISGRSDNSLFQCPGRFVRECKRASLLDFFGGERGTRGVGKQGIDRRVHI